MGFACCSVTLNLTNSTISGNSSTGHGGGIGTSGATIRNSTITDNSAGFTGGGIWRWGGAGTIEIANTIVAENVADVAGNDLAGAFATIQDSLIGDITGATITTNVNNLIGVDPQLLPLGDYGGATQSHALHPDSPAINAGNNALAAGLDQRGANRLNGKVDLGAFEAQGYSFTLSAGNNQSTTVNTNFATDLQVQVVETFEDKPLPIAGIEITLNPLGTGANASLGNTTLTTE
ncbi:MAG: hypothetical protein F6K41_45240 [Symploca sp. SIO3E6]|nr:hypothetical protein [Caldora sp. SIO3E6]